MTLHSIASTFFLPILVGEGSLKAVYRYYDAIEEMKPFYLLMEETYSQQVEIKPSSEIKNLLTRLRFNDWSNTKSLDEVVSNEFELRTALRAMMKNPQYNFCNTLKLELTSQGKVPRYNLPMGLNSEQIVSTYLWEVYFKEKENLDQCR